MYIMFGIFKDNRCNGHHYGEWREIDEYRSKDEYIYQIESPFAEEETKTYRDEQKALVMSNGNIENVFDVLILEQKEVRTCKHNNCSSKEERWVEKGVVKFDDYVEFMKNNK